MSDTMAKVSILPLRPRGHRDLSGRNFVTSRSRPPQGLQRLYGLGDATLNGVSWRCDYLTDHVIPTLIGRDAHQMKTSGNSCTAAPIGAGACQMTAIAAVDMALWTSRPRRGMPLYQLLAAVPEGVRVYGTPTAIYRRDDRRSQTVPRHGYTAIRLQAGVPGLPSTYGVSRDKMFYEPRTARCNRERWSPANTCRPCRSCSRLPVRRWGGN